MVPGGEYRPDIDGLRALAVIPIVLFHAHVVGFSGGYVGVDIFFVISGFLIATIILPQMVGQNFSIFAFYDRRVRRILPPFFAMVALVNVVCAIIFIPSDLEVFGKSVIGAALFAPNVVFATENGYFGAASDLKPLLHSWSLGVEEQFYLIFPLTLWLLLCADRRITIALIAMIGLASFATGLVATDRWPSFAFFMLPARAWELMVGALIALGAAPVVSNRWVGEIFAIAGVSMILWSVFTYADYTPFPGFAALLPVLGSALAIYAGQGSVVGQVLAMQPLRYIGLISYSLYLWHWPVIVIWQYVTLHHLTGWETAGAISLSILLAIASNYGVEKPFRRAGGVLDRRNLFLLAIVVNLLTLAAGVSILLTHGLSFRKSDATSYATKMGAERAKLMTSPCLAMNKAGNVPANCQWPMPPSEKPELVLWGDSHGAQLATAIHAAADKRGLPWMQVTKSGCPPIPTWDLYPHDSQRSECPSFDHAALIRAGSVPRGSLVLLAARWDAVTSGELRFAATRAKPFLGESITTAQYELREVVKYLTAKGLQVVVVAQVPIPPQDINNCLERARFRNAKTELCNDFMPEDTARAAAIEKSTLDFLAGATAGLRHTLVVRPWPDLCDHHTCYMVGAEGPLYLDATHLSKAGATRVLHSIDAALKAVPPGDRVSAVTLY